MRKFRYLDNVTTLELLPQGCIGCGRCVEVCPHQVFNVSDRQAVIVDRDACMECGACARNCPAGVIKVAAGVGCASGLINEWLMEKKIRSSGNCCS